MIDKERLDAIKARNADGYTFGNDVEDLIAEIEADSKRWPFTHERSLPDAIAEIRRLKLDQCDPDDCLLRDTAASFRDERDDACEMVDDLLLAMRGK